MDDFPVNGFDNKVSRSPSCQNEAVLSVKLDFVEKTISKDVLLCLIWFAAASLENRRFVQLPVMVPHRANRVNLIGLHDSRKIPHVEAVLSLSDSQCIIGVALGENQQLFSGRLCDVPSGFYDGDRKFRPKSLDERPSHDAHEGGVSVRLSLSLPECAILNQSLVEFLMAALA